MKMSQSSCRRKSHLGDPCLCAVHCEPQQSPLAARFARALCASSLQKCSGLWASINQSAAGLHVSQAEHCTRWAPNNSFAASTSAPVPLNQLWMRHWPSSSTPPQCVVPKMPAWTLAQCRQAASLDLLFPCNTCCQFAAFTHTIRHVSRFLIML